ncbi:MAG: hypothetical protein ACLGI6_18055 [Gammaproteobacteria bacterium]
MKTFSDYTFYDAWQLRELNMKAGDAYRVLTTIDDLAEGDVVRCVGFDDVDNHYGIFVFEDAAGKLREVRGDFSGDQSLGRLRTALARI